MNVQVHSFDTGTLPNRRLEAVFIVFHCLYVGCRWQQAKGSYQGTYAVTIIVPSTGGNSLKPISTISIAGRPSYQAGMLTIPGAVMASMHGPVIDGAVDQAWGVMEEAANNKARCSKMG